MKKLLLLNLFLFGCIHIVNASESESRKRFRVLPIRRPGVMDIKPESTKKLRTTSPVEDVSPVVENTRASEHRGILKLGEKKSRARSVSFLLPAADKPQVTVEGALALLSFIQNSC